MTYTDTVKMTAEELALKEEMAKCDIRCANCHRRKHWADSYKVSMLKKNTTPQAVES